MAKYVDWYGPFTIDDIRDVYLQSTDAQRLNINSLNHTGLYAFTGIRNQMANNRLQYIGITKECFHWRFSAPDHPHWRIDDESKQVWLGKISNRRYLRAAEHILISTCNSLLKKDGAALLNDRLLYFPAFERAVISQFFWPIIDPCANQKPDENRISYRNVPAIIRAIPEAIIWEPARGELKYIKKLNSFIPKRKR